MSFTLREPTLGDAENIAELHVSTWREAYAHLLPDGFFTEEFIDGRRRMWNYVLENPREDWSIRVAESDGEIIGWAFVGPSLPVEGHDVPRERQLYSIYVAAAHYGTGAGQALLDATLGDDPVSLWVATGNPRAIAFYRRNGFEFDGAEHADPGTPGIVEARMLR